MDQHASDLTAMAADLAAWGKVLSLETSGRHSGRVRRVTIGIVDEPGPALLVAAASPETHWAANLLADPRCWVEHDGIRGAYLAEPLSGDARNTAIAALILKYGTPSERLGAGPAFRRVPVTGCV